MSAWIVSRAHIDVLVQGLCEGGHVGLNPDDVGKILWKENHASVNYRYSETTRTPGYRYRRPAQKITPSGLLYALHCYGYQSCEHPGWPGSQAFRWVSDLMEVLEKHPDVETDPPFGKYPWGYSEKDVH